MSLALLTMVGPCRACWELACGGDVSFSAGKFGDGEIDECG